MKKNGRRRSKSVTMHEAAKQIGVSPMTVSRVLSGSVNVKAETRERVQAAIKKLGYVPDVAARNLAKGSAVLIGLVYNNPSSAYLNELLIGVLEQTRQQGCQVILEKCSAHGEQAAIGNLLNAGVNAIILPPPLSDSKVALETLRAAEVPFIAVATGRPKNVDLSIRINDLEAAAAMTRYLVTLGHRDVGFIVGPPNQTASAQRFAGFKAALSDAGLKLHKEWVKYGAFSYRSGLLAAEQILASALRPSALFASNDDMAAAAVAVAHRLGLDVPGDITIAGFDDSPLASTIWPTLTTVRQPIASMARKSVEILLEEISLNRQGKTLAPLQHILKFSLVKRESSGQVMDSVRLNPQKTI